ncbi:transcriptional regulator, LacI family [Arenibacter nanhaiticus]|uniref:Transcriptional regulator, LacI family n=1 Tax=Arenibacter nanhaiticus TaxID=558155 RepID=A0A1M6HBE6_9FLAO|nr:LacI family DNA-binding transcriptional regulator [Arenibacter nanhaiticus]SHJ19456.1 transcriptional regulator, LacI family [Arenibacter nanhaiticus]
MENNKITIHDIAKKLNINSSTVSRALNNSPRVTQKTKDKIIAAANEMGYQRNLLASSLRTSRTHTIGIIVPRISRHFFSSAIAGIEETAYEAGYHVFICQSLEQLEREQNLVNTLLANRVDGVMVSISMETENYDHFQGLKNRGVPLVFFDRHCDIPGYNTVLIDDFRAGFEATEHLIVQGCKNIAHLSGPQNVEIYKNRFKGYQKALEKYHIPFKEEMVFSSRLMEKDGAESAKSILALNTKVDGLFSANDVAAIGAMQYFKEKGIKIPHDIAIVGFSNEPISGIMEPSLTTIDQPGFEMGRLATNLLVSQIENKAKEIMKETIVLKPSLIERRSSIK